MRVLSRPWPGYSGPLPVGTTVRITGTAKKKVNGVWVIIENRDWFTHGYYMCRNLVTDDLLDLDYTNVERINPLEALACSAD